MQWCCSSRHIQVTITEIMECWGTLAHNKTHRGQRFIAFCTLQSLQSKLWMTLNRSRSPFWWQHARAAKNKCGTLQSSDKESQGLDIIKAIPSIPGYLVLYYIFHSVLSSLQFQMPQKKKAFHHLSTKNMPQPKALWGKASPRIANSQPISYPSGYLCKTLVLSSTASLLAVSNFIQVHF